MRLLLFYAALAGGIGALLYGFPEFRKFTIKHKRRSVLAVFVPALLITIIYLLENYNV